MLLLTTYHEDELFIRTCRTNNLFFLK